MYSGRVDVDSINPAKIMKLITASDLYQVIMATIMIFIKIFLRSRMSERVLRQLYWKISKKTLQLTISYLGINFLRFFRIPSSFKLA